MTTDVDEALLTPPGRSGVTSGYRYPGSPPFQDTDIDRELFRGRAKEADTVLQSILSSNLLVLYSVSGLGKSSLLNAGVMHRLRERKHWPVSVRLNDPTAPIVGLIRKQIEGAAQADPTVELTEDPTAAPGSAVPTLWTMLASLEVWKRNDLQQLVVVLDQFEELFTLGWPDGQRRAFIQQFGEVLRGFQLDRPDDPASGAVPLPPPRVKFVIVIREDSLGELEALSRDVPQIMHNRFRLEPLRLDQAEAAIREPALLDDTRLDTQRFEYTQAASDLILEFLRTRTVRGTVVHSDVVDPCQMQIVCQYVERTILPAKRSAAPRASIVIDAADLGGRAGLEGVLRHFYQRTVETFPAAKQKAVRELCENGLINKSRRRLSLDEEEIGVTYRVLPADLEQLVDERLLRADQRLDSVYYELAHDTLIDPILDYRDEQRTQAARRRRRRLGAAAGVALTVLVAALLVVIVQRRSADGPDRRQLGLGAPLAGVVDEGSGETSFELAAPAGSVSLVTVTPTGADGERLDLAIELSRSAGTVRQEDRLVAGQAERMVIPTSNGGEAPVLRVSSLGAASGSFTIAAETLDVTDIEPNAPRVGRIVDPGGVSVYRVEGAGATSTVMDVRPFGQELYGYDAGFPSGYPGPSTGPGGAQTSNEGNGIPSEKEDKDPTQLDANIEVIDPSGAATRVDSAGAGAMERFAMTGSTGSYLVVVRGYQTSVGEFEVNVSESTSLRPGESRGMELSADGPVNVAVEVTGSEVLVARVVPGVNTEVRLAVLRPDQVVVTTDGGFGSEAAAIISGPPGQYVVSVSGYPVGGAFDIDVVTVEPEPLPVGTSVTAVAGDVLEVAVGAEPLILLVDPHDDADPMLQIMDPSGTTRRLDDQGSDGAEARLLVAEGSHVLRVTDYAGGTGGVDIIAIPATSATEIDVERTATVATPAVFVVDRDDEPLTFTARADSPDGAVDIQVLDPDGYRLPTGSSFAPAAPGDPVTATVGGVRPGSYHVVVSSSVDRDEVTGSLSTIPTLTDGVPVTLTGPRTFLVELGPDEMSRVTADVPDGFVSVEVVGPDGETPMMDLGGLDPPRDGPVFALVGGAGAGTYEVRVVPSGAAGEATVTLESVSVQALAPGRSVTVPATAAIFDIAVDEGAPLELTAASTSTTGVLDIQVTDPSGFMSPIAMDMVQPLPAELPDDVAALFPPEVVELFADGLPATVDEATSVLSDAGLLDEVLAVFEEHPEVAAALLDPPSSLAGAPASTLVGGSGPGTYQVIVTSSDPQSEVTVSLEPVRVRPLAVGTTETVDAPAAFDVEIAGPPRVVTAASDLNGALVDIEVVDPYGQVGFGVSSPSAAPGQPATAIVGGMGPGTYRVIVRSSLDGGAILVELR